jgi:predicted small lipoprotein YifL
LRFIHGKRFPLSFGFCLIEMYRLGLLLLTCLAAACGMKGPLVLPPQPAPISAAPSAVPEAPAPALPQDDSKVDASSRP